MNNEELLKLEQQELELEEELYELEQELQNSVFQGVIDYSSMYPSILRLLNAGLDTLVGFLDNDPIAYRLIGHTEKTNYKEESKKLLKEQKYRDSKYIKFVGKNETNLALRIKLYNHEFDDKSIDDICETPFERYFLALIKGDTTQKFKFQDKEYNAFEFYNMLRENNYTLSASGAIYKRFIEKDDDPDNQALVPSYMSFLFKERKRIKKIKLKYHKKQSALEKLKIFLEENNE